MDKNEVIELIKMIKGAYGNKFEINEHTVDSWKVLLGEQSYNETIELFKKYLREGKDDYPPGLNKLIVKKPEREVPMYVRPHS